MLDLRIDGGRVVRSTGEPRVESIGIRRGAIAAVGDLRDVPSQQTIDVSGAHVFPGAIDTHFHIGFTSPEDEWRTESGSAAIGGVTTIMAYFRNPAPYDELLAEFIDQARADSFVDFAVHLGILNDDHLTNLESYVDRFSLRSIKMYTTYKSGELAHFGIIGQDDGFIFDVFRRAATIKGLVVNVHCENDDMVERGARLWSDPSRSDLEQWSAVRPVVAEVEAIRRVAYLARQADCSLFIPHVSSMPALAAALEERAQGTRLFIETCPHYLTAPQLSAAGVLAKVNPPIRSPAESDGLWKALSDGQIDAYGSDHAAHTRKVKDVGNVITAKPGFPGAATFLPVLINGIAQGKAPIQVAARLQENAARIFGLQGKGALRPGYDADLVVVDLDASRKVAAEALGGISDFSPYEGLELRGWPTMTIVRGQLVAQDGELTGRNMGRYVRDAE